MVHNIYLFIYYVNKASRQTRDYKRRIYSEKQTSYKQKTTYGNVQS